MKTVPKPPRPTYAPARVVIEMQRLLAAQGIRASSTVERLHDALSAASDLLDALEIEPTPRTVR